MLKLLVPVDGSENSDRAVQRLIDFVKRAGPAEVHVLNVQPPIVTGEVTPLLSVEQVEELHREQGAQAIKSACSLLTSAHIPHDDHIETGDVAKTIADFAAQQHCDEIIMGTRGMGAIGNFVLGSIASKVVHRAPVPVMLVK